MAENPIQPELPEEKLTPDDFIEIDATPLHESEAYIDIYASSPAEEPTQISSPTNFFETVREAEPTPQSSTTETRRIPDSHALSIRPPESDEDRLREFAPELIRQPSTGRLAVFPLSLGLIGLGLLLLAPQYIEGLKVTAGNAAVIFTGALILTFFFRFFISGRRERGLFFLGLVLLLWGGVIAMTILASDEFPIQDFYPLLLGGVGIACFFTFLFERTHQIGLVLPGVMLIFASSVALTLTLDIITQETRDFITDYYPLLVTFFGITLLPAVLRKSLKS